MGIALPPAALLQVIFQVRVALKRRKWNSRRAAKVGVQHHSRRVDHALQRRRAQRFNILPHLRLKIVHRFTGADGGQHAARLIDDQRARRVHIGKTPGEFIDGREIAQVQTVILLFPQGDHGIDPGGPPRRDVAGRSGHGGQRERREE